MMGLMTSFNENEQWIELNQMQDTLMKIKSDKYTANYFDSYKPRSITDSP